MFLRQVRWSREGWRKHIPLTVTIAQLAIETVNIKEGLEGNLAKIFQSFWVRLETTFLQHLTLGKGRRLGHPHNASTVRMKWKSYFYVPPCILSKKRKKKERKEGRKKEGKGGRKRKEGKEEKGKAKKTSWIRQKLSGHILGMLHADVCVYDCVGTCMLDFS